MEVKNWEEGNHCFGEYLRINGEDFEDLNQEEVLKFVIEQLNVSRNKTYILQKTLQMVLEDMDFEIEDSNSSSCEQCGNWNYSTKYVKQ